MMRLNVLIPILCAAVCCCAAGCSGKSDSGNPGAATEPVMEEAEVLHASASVLDSMALNADDLTPRRAVSLLNGYVEIYRNSRSSRSKAVTMRKFVDVYDILISNYGDEFRNAVSSAANEETNLRELYQEFRGKLAGYDEASGMVAEPSVPKDSTATEPVDSTIVSE